MSDDSQQPIVVKRIKKTAAGAHGGAWKIAYADFVTAMMAFFLLMWLLGSTAQGDLQGIADFFNTPLKVALQGGSGTGDSSSVIQGGGEDLTRSVGQVKRGDVESRSTINLDVAGGVASVEGNAFIDDEEAEKRKSLEKADRARLIDLQGQIDALIEASASLRGLKNQLLMDVTKEGLRIQIVDEQNRPMFDQSSSVLKPYTSELLTTIGRALNAVPNSISLTGHTDSTRYAGGERGFSNWELSSNRANASRRQLVAGGLDPGKILRVVGLADTVPFIPEDPAAAANRRISIVVLSREGEAAAKGGDLQMRSDSPLDVGQINQRMENQRARAAEPVAPTPGERRPRFRERYESSARP